MGFLNRWFNKKKEDQLAAIEKKGSESFVGAKKEDRRSISEPAKLDSALVEKPKAGQAEKPAVKLKGSSAHVFNVLVKPVVSENAAKMESRGTYVFVVDRRANKHQVFGAVKELYGVAAEKVRIINLEGKKTRFGRQEGQRKNWKKAIVTLPKGQTINIHEGV